MQKYKQAVSHQLLKQKINEFSLIWFKHNFYAVYKKIIDFLLKTLIIKKYYLKLPITSITYR